MDETPSGTPDEQEGETTPMGPQETNPDADAPDDPKVEDLPGIASDDEPEIGG